MFLAQAAHAGTYVWSDNTGQSPVYSGGTATSGDGSTAAYAVGNGPNGFYGANVYGENAWFNNDDSGPVGCSGQITATFTWKPAYSGEPPPTKVIVDTTSDVGYGDANDADNTAQGACDDAFSDAAQDYYPGSGPWVCLRATGEHYSVQNGGQTVTIHCSPSASASVDDDADEWACWAGCNIAVYPVTVDLSGVTANPDAAHPAVLTGQQVTATLDLGGAPVTVSSYQWSVGGDAFETYDTTAPNSTNTTQLVPLSAADLTQSSLSFYDKTQENLTVGCTATFTPTGGTALTLTAQSPQISVLKPTATWTVQAGYIQRFTLPNSPGYVYWGIYQDPGTSEQFGMDWSNITFTMPSGFPLAGIGSFTQLVTPERTVTSGGVSVAEPGFNNGVQALDTAANFQQWNLPDTGSGGDSPATGIQSAYATSYPGSVGDGVLVQDSFQTWLMYMPPSSGTGTVWVPIQKYSWNVNFYTSWSGSAWTYAQSSPIPDQTYSPSVTNAPPTWSSIQTGVNYTPN